MTIIILIIIIIIITIYIYIYIIIYIYIYVFMRETGLVLYLSQTDQAVGARGSGTNLKPLVCGEWKTQLFRKRHLPVPPRPLSSSLLIMV